MIRVGWVPMGIDSLSASETILNDHQDNVSECILTIAMVHYLRGATFIAIDINPGSEVGDGMWYYFRSSFK